MAPVNNVQANRNLYVNPFASTSVSAIPKSDGSPYLTPVPPVNQVVKGNPNRPNTRQDDTTFYRLG
jgi:hypothetical protein